MQESIKILIRNSSGKYGNLPLISYLYYTIKDLFIPDKQAIISSKSNYILYNLYLIFIDFEQSTKVNPRACNLNIADLFLASLE